MAQELKLKIKGLYSNPNPFSEAPEGALEVADNVVLDRESIVATRRGLRQYGDPVDLTASVLRLYEYKETLIAHNDNDTLAYDAAGDGSTWTTFAGTYQTPIAADGSSRIQTAEANKNLYLTTRNGIYKMTAPDVEPLPAGAPQALGGEGVVSGTTGFMDDDTNVAYRIVWGYRDTSDNLILGAPSDRIVVSNGSGGTRNVDLTFLVPEGIIVGYFYQVYRSGASASANDEPNDEMQQVYEASVTSGDITAGFITITDTTPADLRQATLYTSPSQQGIENSNYQPPFAEDIVAYKQYVWYGNTRTLHRFFLTLTAVDGSLGIDIGDTITITDTATLATFTITGAAAEYTSAGEFKVHTGGSPSENIELTARSIVKVINIYAANTFINAHYISGFDELPGQIQLVKATLNADPFYAVSSITTCWSPTIPTSGQLTTNSSTNEVRANRVYYSKFQQPEAVPLYRYFDVGSADDPIEHMVALRDGIIVLKTDGVFRISGDTDASFRVSLLDNTVKILAPNSADVLANQVFFFSTQGVVAASEQGVAVISRPIENVILQLSSDQYPNFRNVTFGKGYESSRKYIVWMPTSAGDTYGTQAYVYNTFTNSWTRWTKPATCALVKSSDDKLYIGGPPIPGVGSNVYQERKTYTSADYADEQYDIDITSVNGTDITVVSTANIRAGDTIQQGAEGAFVIVASVDSATELTADRLSALVIGPATTYRPISVSIQFDQVSAGNPAILKHWRDCSFLFADAGFTQATATFFSDYSSNANNVTIKAVRFGAWGQFAWGAIPWGGYQSGQERLRTLIPKEAARCNWLTTRLALSQAFQSLSLQGLSYTYEAMTERQRA